MGMQKAISHQPEHVSGNYANDESRKKALMQSPIGSPSAGPKEFQRQSLKHPPENPNFLSVSNVHKDTSKGEED